VGKIARIGALAGSMAAGDFAHRTAAAPRQNGNMSARSGSAGLIGCADAAMMQSPCEGKAVMRKLAIVMAGALLCAAASAAAPALARPRAAQLLAPPPSCSPNTCWWYPSYHDTPPDLRPQVFFGFEPHRPRGWQADWFADHRTRPPR
jgi:hypothetical protein